LESEEERCARGKKFQRIDVNGLFYGVDGMRAGGTRRLEITPHLAYGEAGVIPAGAV
jgi:FKBP-type peptidyl-prolyl cis-trans isomerase